MKKNKTKKSSSALAESKYIGTDADPAHAPGHKKVNLKAGSTAPTSGLSASSKIKKPPTTNRRIITGAALGKTGQMVIK